MTQDSQATASRTRQRRRPLWAPALVLAVVMGALSTMDLKATYGSPVLLISLNFVFFTLVALFVAHLLGRSFLMRGEPSLLLFGCGVMVLGVIGIVSVVHGGNDPNANVTIHNLGVWVAALCHFLGAVAPIRKRCSRNSAAGYLVTGYIAALGATAVLGEVVGRDWMPPFFVQGEGGTPLRQAVLGSAVGMFAATGSILLVRNRKAPSSFVRWYGHALILLALGLWGVFIQRSFGDALNWTARGTQYLGGLYLLAAGLISVRDSHGWEVSLERALSVARRRYEDLINWAADGIVVHEAAPPGRFLQANPAACEMLGYTVDEIRRLSPPDITAPAASPSNWTSDAVLRGGVFQHEQTLVHRNGSRISAEIRTRPYQEDGRWLLMSVIRDVTERKRVERQLLEAQKLESVGLLAGGIAHDFNNLLVGIVGNASLAMEMLPEGHPVGKMLQNVLESGESAANLTRQMLAYAGKGQFVCEPIDLSRLCTEVLGLVRHSLSKKVTVDLQLAAGLPAVLADRGQLQQVLMNLLINAGEAIGDASGRISVATGTRRFEAGEEEAPEAGDYVWVAVADTGCGMNAETKARIFDPFFTTKFTGRGLGLAAVHGIVRSHQGAISVVTEPGRGSRFTVLFPASSGAPRELPARRGMDQLHGHGTVLIVDDEEPVRTMAQRTLEAFGYTPVAAASGSAAIELIRGTGLDPDLVLLDWSMPELDGLQALEQLRNICPSLKVIACSGFSREELVRSFDSLGVTAFLQKPFTARQLAEAVASALTRPD